jgi:hypothetical protein
MVAWGAMTTASALVGMGQHAEDLTTETFAKAMFLELIAQSIVSIVIGMAKVVVALFLMRIVVDKWLVSLLGSAVVLYVS